MKWIFTTVEKNFTLQDSHTELSFKLKAHSEAISGNCKTFRNNEKFFSFHLKISFLLKIVNFLSWFFGNIEKRFD